MTTGANARAKEVTLLFSILAWHAASTIAAHGIMSVIAGRDKKLTRRAVGAWAALAIEGCALGHCSSVAWLAGER